MTPEGAVRFVAVDCGGESGGAPLVTLDGQPQPGMTPDKARELAQSLRASNMQTARV